MGYLQFLTDDALRSPVADIVTVVLIPMTVVAVGAGAFALANQPR